MAAEDICKDYASSLGDLTFNSKPLINVLTMLADENRQHAAEIVKLIEKRIYEVAIEQKLPSLYLMDSIVKNIGEDYITAVSPCIVALFTHVFEQADEKIRMSMFKLRNTWPPYLSIKLLHELDCSVHKRDPGWPVVEPPPPSPSIHINPKFLSKVEENVEESCSSSDEAKIMDEFDRKKKELEELQGEQMRLQMMQLEELRMKYELIKKKQEKDRQNLLKQQKEKILKMRLQQEDVDSAEESSSDSKLSEGSASVKQSIRDPRLKKLEQVTDNKTDTSTNNVEAETLEEEPSAVKTATIVDNAVKTATIVDKAVKTATIVDNAVKTATIVDNAVKTATIVDNAVKTATIVDNAVKTATIVDNAVKTASIVDKAVKTATIVDKAVKTATIVDKAVKTATIVDNAVKTASIVDKPVDKVGFDLEFVPLDKDDDTVKTTPSLTYNRDRPLGKNRYFRKDPKAKITKSDSDSGSDFADSKVSRSDSHEAKKRLRGIGHRNYRQRLEPTKENDRHETLDERKRSDRGRGRRRHSGDRPGNHSNDRSGEPTAGHDRPDGRDHHRPGEHSDDRLGKRRGDFPDAPDRPGVRPGGNRLGERPDEIGRRGDRPGEHPNRPGPRDLGDRPGRRPDDHSGRGRPGDLHGERPRGRLSKRPGDLVDIGHIHPLRREHDEYESIHGSRLDRREEWTRGRGQRRPHRGHLLEGNMDGRLQHPQPVDNTGRLPDRRDQGFDRPDGVAFECGPGEEPPFKKSRSSPPRPLFSEKEISEIREKRHDSPDHPFEQTGYHEPWRHENIRQPPPEFFDNQGPHLGLRPPHFPLPRDAPFAPRGMPREFLRPPQHFPGELEIPMELALDNESEILRSAEHRLRTGDLSLEQHHELLEKLHQFYELQKWQRRRSLDMQPHHELSQPPLHPHAAGIPPQSRPPDTHLNNDRNQMPERMMLGEPLSDMLARQPHLVYPADMTGEDRPHSPMADPLLPRNHEPDVLPDKIHPAEDENPPSNLVMEKQTVDDLFKRLMDVGIITKVNQGLSPARVMTPPVVEAHVLKEIPVPQIPELPEIKLTLDHLRRRYDGVIMELHRGTQCSSCGLRFKEANNENYRQHLDWHFRMNRKEKETVAAHRSWFITTDDWLEFESSEDPKLKARSAVFEAESEGESEKSEDLQEGSCPVLIDDKESERQCDICFEKFETFWDETSEDWHYKNAVRVDGKTYHYLCYQDAKEAGDSDVEASDERENTEDNEDDNNDTSENNEAVTIASSITDDKPSIVTQDTTLESGVDSVVQGSDELAVNNSNKEEIKTESS